MCFRGLAMGMVVVLLPSSRVCDGYGCFALPFHGLAMDMVRVELLLKELLVSQSA